MAGAVALCRHLTGFGPLGLLLAVPFALLALAFLLIALDMAWQAYDHPRLLVMAAVEMAGALAALHVVRYVHAHVPQETHRESL